MREGVASDATLIQSYYIFVNTYKGTDYKHKHVSICQERHRSSKMTKRGQAIYGPVASCDLTPLVMRLNTSMMSKDINAGPSLPILFAVVSGIQGPCNKYRLLNVHWI